MGEISDEQHWTTAPPERERTPPPAFLDLSFTEDDQTPNSTSINDFPVIGGLPIPHLNPMRAHVCLS